MSPTATQTATRVTRTPAASKSASGTRTVSSSRTSPPSTTVFITPSPALSQTPSSSASASSSDTARSTTTASASPSGTATSSSSVSASITVLPSPTSSASLIPSPTPGPFQANNIAVLRVGSGVGPLVSGQAAAVFIDEYFPWSGGGLASSTSVTSNAPGSLSCTLSAISSAGWLYDQEGIPSLTTDGLHIVFPCYTMVVGATLTGTGVKVAAQICYDRSVRFVTTATIATGVSATGSPHVLRTIASDGINMWWAAQGAGTDNAIVLTAWAGTTSTILCSYSVYTPCALNAGGARFVFCVAYVYPLTLVFQLAAAPEPRPAPPATCLMGRCRFTTAD